MTRKIYNTFRAAMLALAVTFAVPSCLEKVPQDAIHINEAMKTFNDAEQTVIGIYSTFKSGALYSGSLTLGPDIQSDLVYAVEGNSNQFGNIWQWDILPTTPEIESVYAALYTVIGQCNFYLDRVEALRETITNDEELKLLDTYTGEVYCARALAYSELIKCYCDAYDAETAKNPDTGVVLRSSYDAVEVARRSTLQQSYEFVLADLAEAERLMDPKDDRADFPVFSNAAAHALHARVALFMKDWETAVAESEKLIGHEDHLFALADINRNPDALMLLWHLDSSQEIIWKVGFTLTSYGAPLGQVFLNHNVDMVNYYPDYVPAQWIISEFGPDDGRSIAYFQEEQTGYPHHLTWPLLMKYNGNVNFINQKIFHVSMPKPLRLAEQYLIQAEALCELGNFTKASDVLNGLLASRFATPVKVGLTADNWKEVISEERAKELYMEGFRLNDLKRWGKGFKRIYQTSSQKEGSSLVKKADDYLFVWPIPKHEIEAPGSQVKQNPSVRKQMK